MERQRPGQAKPLLLSFGFSSSFSLFSVAEGGASSNPEGCFGCLDWLLWLSGSLATEVVALPFWGALLWLFGVDNSLPFGLPRAPGFPFPFPPLAFLFLLEKVKGQVDHESICLGTGLGYQLKAKHSGLKRGQHRCFTLHLSFSQLSQHALL